MDIQFWIDNADSLLHQIFMIVMGGLSGLAFVLGTTYNVINVLVYYILVPASWIYFISRKTTVWLNGISFVMLLGYLLQPDIQGTSDNIFNWSVELLNSLAVIFGSNYIDMSVYICVVLIGLVYLALIIFTLPKRVTKYILVGTGIVFVLYMIVVFPIFKSLLLKHL